MSHTNTPPKLCDGDVTLRDKFAMVALHAQVSARISLTPFTNSTAEDAYKMADAMMKARKL